MQNEKLKKKLAEFAGFVWHYKGEDFEGRPNLYDWVEAPKGKSIYGQQLEKIPNLIESLDALFKWITPEVNKKHYIASACSYEGDLCQGRLVPEPGFDFLPIYHNLQKKGKEALALSKAVEGLIDEEAKDENR